MGALQEDLGAGGCVFDAEEDAEVLSGLVADVVGEQGHQAVVQVDRCGQVLAGVAVALVGQDAGEPQVHAWPLSRWRVCWSR